MAGLSALVALALAACIAVLTGALVWRRRRLRKAQAIGRPPVPLPRVPLRSQVIVVNTGSFDPADHESDGEALPSETPTQMPAMGEELLVREEPSAQERPPVHQVRSVHEAPTREFAAHVEELAALSMHNSPTRELRAYEPPTREFAAHLDESLARHAGLPPASQAASERVRADSGVQPRACASSERTDQEATLKVGPGAAQGPSGPTEAELLRMLGPSPTPDLGNIEIYYRLAFLYLAAGNDAEARRCFLVVEEISPGYRDASTYLAQLPIYAPTSTGPTPVHHVVTNSGFVATRGASTSVSEPTRGRRNGR